MMKVALITALGSLAALSPVSSPETTSPLPLRIRCEPVSTLTVKYTLFAGEVLLGMRAVNTVQRALAPVRPEQSVYPLETMVAGRAADRIHAFIHCAGYQAVFFTQRLPSTGRRPIEISLRPLATIPLRGSIVSPPAREMGPLSIEAQYFASFTSFFREIDGGGVQFTVGSSIVADDGSFEIMVPDFAHDPGIAPFSDRGFLSLHTRQPRTGNRPYALEQTRQPGHSVMLPVAPSYDPLELYAFYR